MPARAEKSTPPTMNLRVESLDLAELARVLERALGGVPPAGYIRGRTAIRDILSAHLRCSDTEAENIVETMIGRGFLRFDGDPQAAGSEGAPWLIRIP